MNSHTAAAEYPFVVRVDVFKDVTRLLRVGIPAAMSSSFMVRDAPVRKANLLDLEGLGKEIWEDVDPRQYIDELRDEWPRP